MTHCFGNFEEEKKLSAESCGKWSGPPLVEKFHRFFNPCPTLRIKKYRLLKKIQEGFFPCRKYHQHRNFGKKMTVTSLKMVEMPWLLHALGGFGGVCFHDFFIWTSIFSENDFFFNFSSVNRLDIVFKKINKKIRNFKCSSF